MPNYKKIAEKWQKAWEKEGIFKVKEDSKKKKFYLLEMWPYPSGSGLHMGHARNYTMGDVFTRFKRMQGFNVLYPMGYDSFGLPAENAAIQAKSHPKVFTENAIKNFIRQQHELGLSYDWDRMNAAHTPQYYHWDQWIFLKMFEKDLVYKKQSEVNWCPDCNTVLANEQVHDGKCWRHSATHVIPKDLDQWFLKITEYADEMYDQIDSLKNWAEDVKTMQKNWISKKKWIDINYEIADTKKTVTVSTTRPDTNFGATFVVIAPEHPLLSKEENLIPEENRKAVDEYIASSKNKTEQERTEEGNKKTGVFTGLYCINGLTKKKMPLWVADFVLFSVGTGIVVGVPGHDIRDFEFAKEFDLPIVRVVVGSDGDTSPITKKEQVQEEEGKMINSGFLNGLDIHLATKKIMDYLEKKGWGKTEWRFRLHDWLISRQRFWGCPIPIIYCDKCGPLPVPEKDLPVKLPDDFKFENVEGNPLALCKEFVNTHCPKCNAPAKRETDTMDTFVDSSWYHIRFCDPKNTKLPIDKKKADYWLPIDMYIGGKEHATMHLIYFRFFHKFLRDIGVVSGDEPTYNLFNQGMLHKDGSVMSKSKGNVISQKEISEKYGIDTARFFLMFIASPDKDMEWDDKAIEGTYRFLNKLYALLTEKKLVTKPIPMQESKVNKAIQLVTKNIEEMKYNIALIAIMDVVNYLHIQEEVDKSVGEKLLLLIAPFAPHIAEELWEKLGNKKFISLAAWPKADIKKIDAKLEAEEDLIHTIRNDVQSVLKLLNKPGADKIQFIVADSWKYALFKKLKKQLGKTHNVGEIIKAVMDKAHGKEIAQLVPRIVKDPSKVPAAVLDQKSEIKTLENASLNQLLDSHVEIVAAEKSDDPKAKNALPGKPAIIIE
ncbi:MAG: leucine--tRNA ligase [Candidatus Woesearchaeota archaeon]|nr:leucine--tRNA ligase [Candidatus Woesearchaeota archaeon]